MNIVIRADASACLGSGHIMRCRALGDELRRQGADVRFVCREQPGHLILLLSAAGYEVTVLPPVEALDQSVDADQTSAALGGVTVDWLIVDHYGLDERWESALRPTASRILAIDDLAGRGHACDVLLDQGWLGSIDNQSPPATRSRCLLGPQYALLQPEFRRLRHRLPPRDGSIRRVLLFLGAVDAANQTAAALGALGTPEMADLTVDVVLGHANAHAALVERLAGGRARTLLHRSLPSLAPLMARADLMLGGGGITTWERCCLGLPAIVTLQAENQRRATDALTAAGVHYALGDAATATAAGWTRALRELRRAPERVRAYSSAARLITDGRGANRVAAVVMHGG